MADERIQPIGRPDHLDCVGQANAQSLYADVFNETPAIVAVLDDRGVILSMSRECATRLSANAARLVGRSILSLAHRDDRAKLAKALADARFDPDRVSHCEFRVWRGKKPSLDLSASIRAANAGDGPGILLAACSDISDQRALKRQLDKRSDELNRMASELLIAQERERRRIAEDMHDGIGHTLALAKFHIDGVGTTDVDEPMRNTIETVQTLLQNAIESVRALSFSLNSPSLHAQGLDAAIEDLGQSLCAGSSLEFSLSSRPRLRRLSQAGRVVIYRIIRELLVNAVKHASAARVRVSIGADEVALHVAVTDDGIGIDPRRLQSSTGSGIRSIRQRLARLEGEINLRRNPGGGTVATFLVPLAQIADQAQ